MSVQIQFRTNISFLLLQRPSTDSKLTRRGLEGMDLTGVYLSHEVAKAPSRDADSCIEANELDMVSTRRAITAVFFGSPTSNDRDLVPFGRDQKVLPSFFHLSYNRP